MNACECLAKLGTERGACFDDAREFRYALWRTWDPDTAPLFFIMLNPSSADADFDDPTINRIGTFARKLGHGGAVVGNAFALVSTDPELLKARTIFAVGPRNDEHLDHLARAAGRVIVGWGSEISHRSLTFRLPGLRRILSATGRVEALAINKDGMPKHPLYVRGDTIPQPYAWNL